MYNFNKDLIYFIKREGTTDNPYSNIEENTTILYEKVFLKEVPVQSFRVVAKVGTTVLSEVSRLEDVKTTSQYYVDYKQGIVYFHIAKNKVLVNLNYRGQGVLLYPASRIYIDSEDGAKDVIKTLKDFIVENANALQALINVETAIRNAEIVTLNANEVFNSINTKMSEITTSELQRIADENTRITNENTRKTAETARGTAESTRNTNENTRKTAETARGTAETARVTAETARATEEGKRVTAETTRKNAETDRNTAETNRVSAETARATVESARVTAESTRNTNENNRKTAETARATAETARATEEGKRVTAESTRVTNENSRIAEETVRKSNESLRVASESSRADSETIRIENEEARKTSESSRVTVESARVTAESSRASAETTRNTNENTRKTNETARGTAESTRNTNENTRKTNETARENAEIARASAESARVIVESDRVSKESSRVTAESARVTAESARATAETARQSKEDARINSENTRISAESARVTNENKRITDENARISAESSRVTVESARVSAETTRNTNENTRKTNETARVNAETARASAETARQTSFSTAIANAERATTSANTSAQNAQSLVDRTVNRREYDATATYYVNNIVAYQGSSYMCIAQSKGNLPTNEQYFQLLALKGLDGKGNVTSVNGFGGEVTLEPSHIGAYSKSETDAKIAELVDTAPDTLNTLNELAQALGDDPNFATTMTNNLANKVDKVTGKDLSTNDYTTAEKTKLAGIATGANNYTHPSTHPASIITQTSTARFVTDAEKALWNAKASTDIVTNVSNGLMPATDKVKIDGIEANANNYVHPANHPASIITQDASNRFVTDAEKALWNAKASTSVATTTSNGLMPFADKVKIDGVSVGANKVLNHANNGSISVDGVEQVVYTHPTTHPASMITQDANNRFMTDAERTKLAGVATGANNYTHPTGAGNNHIPTGGATGNFLKYSASGTAVWSTPTSADITESTTKKFVSDAQITDWTAKETTSGAQTKADTAEANAKTYADNKAKIGGKFEWQYNAVTNSLDLVVIQ